MMKIWFDMDGTIADLYGVENWLDYLIAYDPTPYEIAKPLINLSRLARKLNYLQSKGYEIGIISWLSKNSTEEYDRLVTDAKLGWLAKHLPSVNWNNVFIVPYGTPKYTLGTGILFDDEMQNRAKWGVLGFKETEIFEILGNL